MTNDGHIRTRGWTHRSSPFWDCSITLSKFLREWSFGLDMPESVFFFLFQVFYACANFIPQADNWGNEFHLISDRFEEVGGSNPIVAGDFGDLPNNSLNLWQSNAVSVIPPSPDQIIADEKLPIEQLPSSEQASSFGRLSESPPANVNIDPVICNSQYRPNVPGFTSKAKRNDDVCKFGKPKCKEHWLSLCCYGSPLADEGGLTAGCIVCMSFNFLSCFNSQAIPMCPFDFLLGKDEMKRKRMGKVNSMFSDEQLSWRVIGLGFFLWQRCRNPGNLYCCSGAEGAPGLFWKGDGKGCVQATEYFIWSFPRSYYLCTRDSSLSRWRWIFGT